MIKQLFLACLFAGMLVSCSSDDDNGGGVDTSILEKEPSLLGKSSMDLMSKENMPVWLAKKITDLEKNAPSMAIYKIYQCKWRAQTIYFINDFFASCALCEVYYADGKKVEWNNVEDVMDFDNNSTEWKCIYVIKAE